MRTLLTIVLSLLALVAAGVSPTDAAGHRPRDAPTAARIETACPVCRAARRLGMRMTPLRRPDNFRCACPKAVSVAALPRGDVLKEDLFVRVELAEEYERGFLGAWTGTTVLGRDRLDTPYFSATLPFPEAWRRGLRPGAVVFWEVEDEDRPTEKTWFRYIELPPEAARALAAIDLELGTEDSRLRSLLRARVFQENDLFVAAWRELRPVLKAEPEEPHALAIERAAIEALGLARWCGRFEHLQERLHAYEAHETSGERCFLDVGEPLPVSIVAPADTGCGGKRAAPTPPPTGTSPRTR